MTREPVLMGEVSLLCRVPCYPDGRTAHRCPRIRKVFVLLAQSLSIRLTPNNLSEAGAPSRRPYFPTNGTW